jgi:hypothetical protein
MNNWQSGGQSANIRQPMLCECRQQAERSLLYARWDQEVGMRWRIYGNNMHHLNCDRPDINLWTEWSSAQYRSIEQQPVWNRPSKKLDDNSYVQSWHPGISNILPAYEDSFMKMALTRDGSIDPELTSDPPSNAHIEAFRSACGWDREEIEWELKIRDGLQEEIRRMGAKEEEIFNLLIQTDACSDSQK